MDRITLVNILNIVNSGDYFIDGFSMSDKVITIESEVNSCIDLLINNLANISELNIVVNEGSQFILSLLSDEEMFKHKIKITVKKNGVLNGYFADFSKAINDFNCQIDLAGEYANCVFKVASLASRSDIKKIDISLVHNHSKTIGRIDCFGVCKDEAKLTFSGVSHIIKGAIKSKTQQNAKVVVFDKASDAVAKPNLKIDENDIEASHAAVVGKINDEHLFYLTSRGLSEADAKELITLGYLKPILIGFKEDDIKNRISSLIEGRM